MKSRCFHTKSRAARISIMEFIAALVAALLLSPAEAHSLEDYKGTGKDGVPCEEQIAVCTEAMKSVEFSGDDLGKAHQARGACGL